MKKTYILTYSAFDKQGKIIKQGRIRMKNRASEADAMMGLEKYFTAELNGFNKLQVLTVKEETASDFLDFFLNLYKPFEK